MESRNRMNYKKIVVAFDGSQDSVKAVESGCELAAKFGSTLVIVHVFSPPIMAYSWAAGAPVVDWTGLETAAKEGASQVLAKGLRLAKDKGISARGELLEGASVVEALADFSANEKADLIVIGTRGMTGLKKLVMGSVSSGLAAHSPCPVLVVR